VVDPLSIEIAAGILTGDAAFGGPEKAVAAHLQANVLELSPLAGLLGSQLDSVSLDAVVTGTESRPTLELNLSGTGIRLSLRGRRGACDGAASAISLQYRSRAACRDVETRRRSVA